MGRVLAIDWGQKRTGLAVTDPLRIVASALETIPTATLEAYLKRYCAQEPVDTIVLGYPTRLDGTDTDSTQRIRTLAKKLKELFPAIPVHLHDERFTSREAKQTLIDSGVNKKARRDKGTLDRIAATIILQSYLQHNP